MTCTYRQANIEGASFRSESISDLLSGTYDMVFVNSSWDSRCVAVASADVRGTTAVVTLFSGRDECGLRDVHDPVLVAFAESTATHSECVCGDSLNIAAVWKQLLARVVAARSQTRRSLRVLLDLSTCPRYIAGAMIGVCLRLGLISELDLFYAEATYPNAQAHLPLAFTGWKWRTVPIPGLQGHYDPGKGRFVMVSVGWEGSKTFRAVGRFDPDRVSVLLPDPGFTDEYTQKAKEANGELIREFVPSEQRMIRAAAGDAVQAWRELDNNPQECPQNENTYYLCCGTKPHSVALALRALTLEFPAVLYNISEHKAIRTEASGVFWRYAIRNTATYG